MEISKTKIDRLGDRLRKGNIVDDDLRLLDEYRRSFTEAYEFVVGSIRQQLALEPTGRPAKSTTSISEKLRRESIRLTQIQDIAGCRLVVPEIADQESVKASIVEIFSGCIVIDRREKPSHGYRAVHVIATTEGKSVEIQLRTALQQAWAELSEKLADVVDPAIKYGGGDENDKELLAEASITIAEEEALEFSALETQRDFEDLLSLDDLPKHRREVIMQVQKHFEVHKANIAAAREDTLIVLRNAVKRFGE
ncbi:MAG TPA: RelA/SpoT domain-containing protein [Pyrinomonadaceae bacterium]|nr:RelA/SpoT domain-containing protein [Pyrinomonadaceae bacterium]